MSLGTILFQPKRAYDDNEVLKMRRLALLIALLVLVMIPAGSCASAVSGTSASPADSNLTHNETTVSQTEATNCSASATTTITMYAVDEEEPG